VGEGYSAVRRGGDSTGLGNEKGEVVREIYDGMGRDVEGAGLTRITGLMLSRSNK